MAVNLKVNKNSHTPIFYQIQEQIKEQIHTGELARGSRVASERHMALELQVSRSTVRKAIRNLIHEGYCVKEVGKGVFVSPGRVTMDIQQFHGFSRFAEARGSAADSTLVERRVAAAGGREAADLEVSPGSNILYLKRLRLLDGDPVVLETTKLPLERFPGLEEQPIAGSLYAVLEGEYGVVAAQARGTIQMAMVDEGDAHLLDLPISSAMMRKDAVAYTEDNVPVEMIAAVYRSDKVIFSFHSRSDPKSK